MERFRRSGRAGRIHRLAAVLGVLLLFTGMPVSAGGDTPYNSYNYTYWGEVAAAPDAYEHQRTVRLLEGDAGYSYPTDLIRAEDGWIVCDAGASRLVWLDDDFQIRRILETFDNSGREDRFHTPTSAVWQNGCLYVADTRNSRILKFDRALRLIAVFGRPAVSTLDEDYSYLPIRIAVDGDDRLYVVAQNINEGVFMLDEEGRFKGFMGAPKVKTNALDLLWRVFSTKEQRARMNSFVPTEYNSLDMDEEGFLYATCSTFAQEDIGAFISDRGASTQFAPVKRLNPSGIDVLRRTGSYPPAGDLRAPNTAMQGAPQLSATLAQRADAILGFSALVDVKALDSGLYFTLDSKRSRVFAYDGDGNLLFLFGGSGTRAGTLSNPVALEVLDSTVYVLNSAAVTIDVFTPSVYGSLLLDASRNYAAGDYEAAQAEWKAVLRHNGNLEQAYVMLGKIHLQNRDYQAAMTAFRNGNSTDGYSKAYRFQRAQTVERYFWLLLPAALAVVLALWGAVRLVRRLARCRGKVGAAFGCVCQSFRVCFHPFNGFYELKMEKKGNLPTAVVLLAMSAYTTVLMAVGVGFLFRSENPQYVNIPFKVLAMLLPNFLFMAANWCLTTLMDGKGTMRDIFIFTCYAQLPLICLQLSAVLLSHILTLQEGAFYTVLLSLANLWWLALLIVGTMVTHDYSMKKTVLTLLLTVLGIVVLVFLGLLLADVTNQMADFFGEIFYELTIL